MKSVMPVVSFTTGAIVFASGLVFAIPRELAIRANNLNLYHEKSKMIVKPKNQMELVKNVKFILENNLLLRDSFYEEKNIKDFFGLSSVYLNIEKTASDDKRILMISSAFDWISASSTNLVHENLPSGANLTGGKTTFKNGEVFAAINLSLDEGGPDFELTKEFFWRSPQ